jgi:hypothetical protein
MSSPVSSFSGTAAGLSCRELANDRCHRSMSRRASFEIAHKMQCEGLGAGECAFH